MASPKTSKTQKRASTKSEATKKKRASTKAESAKKKRASTKAGASKAGAAKRASSKAGAAKRASSKAGAAKRASSKAGAAKPKAAKPARSAASKSRRAATERTHTPVPSARVGTEVGVFESGKSNQSRAVSVVESLGFDAATADSLELMLTRLAEAPPSVLLVGLPEGQRVIDAALQRGDDRPVLVAALAGPSTTAHARCVESGADLLAVRPLSRDALASTLHAAVALTKHRKQLIALRGTEAILRQRLQRYGQADNATGFQHVDFFKRQLVMEIKRAKRYGYSLAVCLVAIDPPQPGAPVPSEAATRKLRTRVASAITAAIREIDLPIDFADDRMLVFLPYTDIAGATSVGKRVAGAVKSYGTINDDGVAVSMSVSVGIAALRPGKPVSFARLMKDAGAAVRAAQLKGGGRIVVRK